MFSASEMAELRADAETEMTLCLVPMKPGTLAKNSDGYDETGYEDQPQHKGKVQSGTSSGRDTITRYIRVGGVELPVLEGGLHIPLCAPIPKPSQVRGQAWEYLVAAVGPADDPVLLNRRYMVVEVPAKSRATARRLNVVEIPADPEV